MLVTILLGLGACAYPRDPALPMVRLRAERDLSCTQDRIAITAEITGQYKAIGCGHKALYHAACEGLTCEVRGENEPAIPWRDRPTRE